MTISKKTKNRAITEGDLSVEKMKIRVNAWLDGEVVLALRNRAKKEGTKYQTLMNQLLRETVLGRNSLESRVIRLENEIFHRKGRK